MVDNKLKLNINMKYIKLFENHSQYEDYAGGGGHAQAKCEPLHSGK